MLTRELNPPGAEQFPDLLAGDYLGYLADGFWDARLYTMLTDYTLVDGSLTVPPETTGVDYITDQASKSEELPTEFQMLVVILAGARLIRNRILTLAVNFQATAGPVEYEQQASATTLRAILATLQKRLDELKRMYTDEFSPGAMVYFDGVLQRVQSDMNDYLAMTVL
jgi:hypothetical protein